MAIADKDKRKHVHYVRTIKGRMVGDEPILFPPDRGLDDNAILFQAQALLSTFPLATTTTKKTSLITALDAFGVSAGIGPIGTNSFKPYFDAIDAERGQIGTKVNQILTILKVR